MVCLIAGNEILSAVPIPSATKSTPPSSDTVTRGPTSRVCVFKGVLRPDGPVVEDGADKRSEKGDADFGIED
jgi:hypothetical protein